MIFMILERHIKVILITESASKFFSLQFDSYYFAKSQIVFQADPTISNTKRKQKLVTYRRGVFNICKRFLRQIVSREMKNRLTQPVRYISCSIYTSSTVYSHLNCFSLSQYRKIWPAQRRFDTGGSRTKTPRTKNPRT